MKLGLRDIKSGKEEMIDIEPVPYQELEQMVLRKIKVTKCKTLEAKEYYFAKEQDKNTYYMQWNVCMESTDESFKDFEQRVVQDLKSSTYRN